jgi:hypothetical protein
MSRTPDHMFESWIRIRTKVSKAIEAKNRAAERAVDAHKWRSGGSKWSPRESAVADSHHFDEKQLPDPDPYKGKSSIRISIKVMWIRNPALKSLSMTNMIF